MHRKTLVAAALALVFVPCGVPASAPPEEPLPNHPGVVAGGLDNGVAYRVLRNGTPPGRVSVRLHVRAGSFNESDDERGYAHLLEHMAFQGSENFPDGKLKPFFESLGMTPGRHQNAFTTFDQTVYMLELPDVGDPSLRGGLTFLADVLARLDLPPGKVEQERAVVLAERRSGLGPGERMMAQWAPVVWRGALTAERLPIGTEDSIAAAERDGLLEFYERWYSTGNATVVVVGDLPEDRAVALVEEVFGALEAGARTGPVDTGEIIYERPFAVVASDPEYTGASVVLNVAGPARAPARTIPELRETLVSSLGTMAFGRRLREKTANGEVTFRGSGVGVADHYGAATIAEVNVSGDAEDWRPMLRESAAELNRARIHGLAEDDIQDAKRAMLARARQVEQAGTSLPSQAIAGALLNGVHNETPVPSPAQYVELYERLLPTIEPAEVSARFAASFEPTDFAVAVHIEDGEHRPTEQEVLAAATDALAAEVIADAARVRPDSLIETLPEPGIVAASGVDDDTGVYSAWFGNGARFHHREMDYRKNHVGVRITLAGGVIEEDAESRGLTTVATSVLSRFATKHRSSTDIHDLFVGRSVRVGLSADASAVTFSIEGQPADLELGFQLAHLLLTEPRLEPVAFEQWRRFMIQMDEAMNRNAQARLTDVLRDHRYPADDPRWRRLSPEELETVRLEHAQAWIESLFARAPVEMSVVGDMDRQTALDLALRYIGSLPVRDRIGPSLFADRRNVVHPSEPLDVVEVIESATPKAAVFVGFPGADHDATNDVRALVQAARVLRARMLRRIREEAGLSYDIGATHRSGSALPGFGTLSSSTDADPADAERLADLIESEYRAFAESGPTEEEAAVALKQFENSYEETARSPGYWMRLLSQNDFRGRDGVNPARTLAGYRKITGERMHEEFKRYFDNGPLMRVIVTPAPRGP